MTFDKQQLDQWRNTVSGPKSKDVTSILTELSKAGFQANDPELKRVPPPFDKDHPNANLLRRKSMTVWKDIDEDVWERPIDFLITGFKTTERFRSWVAKSI